MSKIATNKVVFLRNHGDYKSNNNVIMVSDGGPEEHYLEEMVYNQGASAYLSATKEEEHFMDDSTRALINRLDQDMRDHKQEIRDRDAALLSDAKERETRYRDEMKVQNDLFRKESQEREERMEKMILSLSSEIKTELNSFKTEIKDQLKEVKAESSQTTKHVQSLVTANTWGFIATVLAIVALACTLFFSLR